MSSKKSGKRTLLMSVLMSAPGPLILGIGLIFGRSSTQIADFIRRTAELMGIIVAFIVYLKTADEDENSDRRKRLERMSNIFVGAMMCIGGTFMIGLALFSENTEKGNVITGLIIAFLGVIANTIFWIKYTSLNKKEPNAIILVQARLYRAKSLVDTCVTVALLSVAILPQSEISYYIDLIGSVIVALYLMWCGIKTIYERAKG
ncbi:MAG: cation transporter [Oscillospiraceae bacterium]|nr:cation transporter [Oscillospiraceae bacterium]